MAQISQFQVQCLFLTNSLKVRLGHLLRLLDARNLIAVCTLMQRWTTVHISILKSSREEFFGVPFIENRVQEIYACHLANGTFFPV